MGALAIIGLSTLPYFHDFITNAEGLKDWVPIFGIQDLLADSNNDILGFSSYRVFLYTFLISVFSTIGFWIWFRNSSKKYYCYAILCIAISSTYHLSLIIFMFRRTILNDPTFKIIGLFILFLLFGIKTFTKNKILLSRIIVWVILFLVSTLPFLHDVFKLGDSLGWIPDLGIEAMLTKDNLVRGLQSYRLFLYLFGTYLFSHLAWIGSFMDAKRKSYRAFLLVPAALSLYQVILISLSSRETEFNSPSINLYITIGLSVLLAINFFFNNRHRVEVKWSKSNKNLKKFQNED